ncbi:YneF family protein [Evansella sp. AB-rgal1]|uniref:YneF family protein n=1 Tax=Evansella sp. AB-rgal1 TaxID=3242696 RepID=UPI00359CBFA4
MAIGWVILIGVLCLLGGVAAGFFIARQYMMSYMKKNPPINEKMLRVMMMQMGMNPSQKKVNQMMKAMQSNMK